MMNEIPTRLNVAYCIVGNFRVFRDLTEFVKVYPANLLILQYKRIMPAYKS